MPHQPVPMLRLAGLVLALAALAGCSLSRQQVRKADAVLAQARKSEPNCQRADHCALASPLLAQADQALAASTPAHPVHYVTLLERGEPALAARLNLIQAASQSIDLQTYIWANDDAGNLVLAALANAARRGVHVRVLADQLFSFQSLEQLAALARISPYLRIRLYNPTFGEAETSPLEWLGSAICCFGRFNQRMHNKLLLVDDKVGITGGRNYQNRYFGWGRQFNFRDRDVLVAGPAARQMAASFELFWTHRRSRPLTTLSDVNQRIVADGPDAPGWYPQPFHQPARVAAVIREAADVDWLHEHILARSLRVGRVDYFSDLPAKTDAPQTAIANEFTLQIMRMVAGARKQIVLQTPYLILSKRARNIFRLLHDGSHPPQVIVSTNSLASTDAFYTYAMTYKRMKSFLVDYGFQIFELKPHPADADISIAPYPPLRMDTAPMDAARVQRSPRHTQHRSKRTRPVPLSSEGMRIGLHAKSIVVDDRFAMVGTHNFDPRSDHYNTESGVIVYDRRFADILRAHILRDTQPGNAWTVAPRRQEIPVLSGVNQVISTVSAHLPWFDLWPFRYATLYTLEPGCTPLAADDPEFYRCYRSAGDFPGVDLPFKTIYTRLLTGFGFGLDGIL